MYSYRRNLMLLKAQPIMVPELLYQMDIAEISILIFPQILIQ